MLYIHVHGWYIQQNGDAVNGEFVDMTEILNDWNDVISIPMHRRCCFDT